MRMANLYPKEPHFLGKWNRETQDWRKKEEREGD